MSEKDRLMPSEVDEVALAGPDVGAFLEKTITEAKAILYTYENDGDWYGCLKRAVEFMEKAGRSRPPDGTIVPGDEPGKLRRY